MEPELTLSTHDGALLAPQDPVTLLLGSPEVKAEVTRWKQHSVTQRYREACNQLNLGTYEPRLGLAEELTNSRFVPFILELLLRSGCTPMGSTHTRLGNVLQGCLTGSEVT